MAGLLVEVLWSFNMFFLRLHVYFPIYTPYYGFVETWTDDWTTVGRLSGVLTVIGTDA